MTARQQFGFLLGLVDLSDALLANNPYGVAFSLGRREQLTIAPAELRRTWNGITDDELRRAAKEVFSPDHHAGAFIAVER
jgi:zinc protease